MKALQSVVALLAVLALAVAVQAKGGGDAPKAPASLKGVVKAVEGDAVTVTVGKGDAAKEVKVATNADTKVVIEGKDAKVADLKAGQNVVVTPAEGVATKIEVPAAKPKGDKH